MAWFRRGCFLALMLGRVGSRDPIRMLGRVLLSKGSQRNRVAWVVFFFSTKKSQENRGYKNESSLGRAKAIAVKLEGFLIGS